MRLPANLRRRGSPIGSRNLTHYRIRVYATSANLANLFPTVARYSVWPRIPAPGAIGGRTRFARFAERHNCFEIHNLCLRTSAGPRFASSQEGTAVTAIALIASGRRFSPALKTCVYPGVGWGPSCATPGSRRSCRTARCGWSYSVGYSTAWGGAEPAAVGRPIAACLRCPRPVSAVRDGGQPGSLLVRPQGRRAVRTWAW